MREKKDHEHNRKDATGLFLRQIQHRLGQRGLQEQTHLSDTQRQRGVRVQAGYLIRCGHKNPFVEKRALKPRNCHCTQQFLGTFLKGGVTVDAFETSVGYRSLDPLSLLEPQAKECFSDEGMLQYAKDLFDAHLAETLRSTGEWHWKLEIREIAEQVIETLHAEERGKYEYLRTAILEYYDTQYRVPTAQEYRNYLRGKREPKPSMPQEPLYAGDIEVELTGLAMMRQCRTIHLSEPLVQSAVEALARETEDNHVWGYQEMQDETIEVTILSQPFSPRGKSTVPQSQA